MSSLLWKGVNIRFVVNSYFGCNRLARIEQVMTIHLNDLKFIASVYQIQV